MPKLREARVAVKRSKAQFKARLVTKVKPYLYTQSTGDKVAMLRETILPPGNVWDPPIKYVSDAGDLWTERGAYSTEYQPLDYLIDLEAHIKKHGFYEPWEVDRRIPRPVGGYHA